MTITGHHDYRLGIAVGGSAAETERTLLPRQLVLVAGSQREDRPGTVCGSDAATVVTKHDGETMRIPRRRVELIELNGRHIGQFLVRGPPEQIGRCLHGVAYGTLSERAVTKKGMELEDRILHVGHVFECLVVVAPAAAGDEAHVAPRVTQRALVPDAYRVAMSPEPPSPRRECAPKVRP